VGHKVNPYGFRLGVIYPWKSNWYARRDYGDQLHEDVWIRKHIRGRLSRAGISSIDIERKGDQIWVFIRTARPGIVIGRKGAEVDRLRKDIERLVEMLARLTTLDGKPLDLTLTTNGALLARKAQSLKDAGLNRVTVSLDAIDDTVFRRMNDVDFAVDEVLHGIEVAQQVGLAPLKVNMVVKKGDNDDQLVPMARHFRGSGIILRFIEYMDVGETNHWDMTSVVPSAEVIQRLSAEFPLEPLSSNYTGETAERWRYADGAGEIGVISSVTHAFCHDCTRARLSTEGKLYLCLFATEGFDLRTLLRNGTTDLELSNVIRAIWQGRTDRYSELRASGQAHPAGRRIEMSYIGG